MDKKFKVYMTDKWSDGEQMSDDKTRLVVERNGQEIASWSDGGEPEDNWFFRDWSGLDFIIAKAYKFGYEDALDTVNLTEKDN